VGVIWRATDTTLRREVAVKMLMDKGVPDSGTAHRFADEALISAQLQHPAIPRCMTSAGCPMTGPSWP
jgi:serine/threonine-protein kinase